jgi:hypothetical protein
MGFFAHMSEGAQMIPGMNLFCASRGAKQARDTIPAVGLGLGGEGDVPGSYIRLAFKGRHQIRDGR